MIKLRVRAPLTVQWSPDSGQWSLNVDSDGVSTVPVRGEPFVIGRSSDCELLLPESPELDKTTSRWHCHVVEVDGRPMVVDGSFRKVPGFGARKPSGTGTWVNGERISEARELRDGDEIGIGPWRFVVEAHDERPAEAAAKAPAVPSGAPRAVSRLARLHQLTQKINETGSIEENLGSILECAVSGAGCAESAALLVDESEESCFVRLAWSRGGGRLDEFPFDSGLVKRLPGDRGALWEKGGNGREAIVVPLWGNEERLGILYLDNRESGAPFADEDLHLANALGNCAALQLLREKEVFLVRVASSMSQYFGPEIVRVLVEEANAGRQMQPEVKEHYASMLFVDLTGFSRYCRGRSPREVSELLNPYLQLVAECIQRNSGHVDKFIGDGVLGVFGAMPRAGAAPEADHAHQAVRAAREIIKEWSKRSSKVIQILLPIRAGINTGRVVAGNIGYAGRMEYSVLGDAVNLASRMEKLALPNGIALTDATRELVSDEFECIDGGFETVKGFGSVRVWRAGA
jgi:adenylate cyclase